MKRQDTNEEQDKGTAVARPRRKRIITRRRALIAGGGLLAAGAVATSGFLIQDHRKRFGRRAEWTIPDHRIDLPASVPKMVIARGNDAALNTRAAVDRLGGMGRFVGADDVVVIKPNIGWERTPAQAANTHPAVVAEVVRACVAAKPKRVIVSDCPVSESRRAFELSGIAKAASQAGAEVIPPEDSRYYTVQISERLGTWDILEPFVIATKVINVPVAKSHTLTGATCGLKNWIGITGKLRLMFHNDLQHSIAELANLMKPTLTVVDASRVLMESGPQGGNLDHVKSVGAVAAGVDPVALDAWACFVLGLQPDEIPMSLHLAEGMGLGQVDFNALAKVEITTG